MSLIDQTIAHLKLAVPAGSQLAVFGSQARGDAGPQSDIDVLVVEPEVANRFAEMARLSALLGRQLIPADVVVMSTRSFNAQKAVVHSLAWRACREGLWHDAGR